jgi:hypothetical protein
MKLSRPRLTRARSEKPVAKYSDSKFTPPEGEHLFSSLHQLDGLIGFALLMTQQAENCNLIPQRNCDRFSRSSMNPPLSLFKVSKNCCPSDHRTLEVSIEVALLQYRASQKESRAVRIQARIAG